MRLARLAVAFAGLVGLRLGVRRSQQRIEPWMSESHSWEPDDVTAARLAKRIA